MARAVGAFRGCLLAAAAGAAVLAGPGFSAAAAAPRVNVVYAGSLAFVNDQVLGPAFQRATGIVYQGRGGGSFGMARELQDRLISGDVFESIGLAPLRELEPRDATWAVRLAATPLVIAYNPASRDAPFFRRVADHQVPLRRLFTFLATHPVKIGRTNPATDPQGQAFYEMVELAQMRFHLPKNTVAKILGPWNNPHQIYSEEGLPTELESGGLDLASAFLPEAIQDRMHFIRLPGWLNFAVGTDFRTYARAKVVLPSGVRRGTVLAIWVTALHRSPTGIRYVKYLVAHARALRRYGYPPLPPLARGTGLPAGLPRS